MAGLLQQFLREHGIVHQTPVSSTAEHQMHLVSFWTSVRPRKVALIHLKRELFHTRCI
jgi:hypothetical protein